MRVAQGIHGFTVVEMLVTIVLAGIFLTFFVQMFRVTSGQQASLTRQATANDIAKSNLNKFPNATDISPSYTCDTSSNTSTNTNNLKIRPSAPGTTILSSSSSNKEPDPGNLGTLVQTVKAYSPAGCTGSYVPIKIESTVEYGFEGQRDKVVYATYIF